MRNFYKLVFLFIIIFILVRMVGIDRGFWQDEFISIRTLNNNFLINPFYFGFTTNLPLYFILLKIYTLFGFFNDPIFLRFFSVFLSLFSAITSFVFIKKYFGLFIATLFFLLICFLPIQIHYSQEVRPYILTQFLIILNIFLVYFYVYYNKYKKNIFLITLLLCLSHYSGIMFSLFLNIMIFSIFAIKKDSQKTKLFALLIAFNILLIFCIFYIFSLNSSFFTSIKESTGRNISLIRIIDFPSNLLNEGLEKIKEVLSFYYFFGLWYYMVDIRVQFIFKKLVLLFLILGFSLESFYFLKLRKISIYWFVFSLFFILMFAGYLLETLGIYPFGGRHIFPYSVLYYFVLIYPFRLFSHKLKIVTILVFLAFVPLFIFHQKCVNYAVKNPNVVISQQETYTYCFNSKLK